VGLADSKIVVSRGEFLRHIVATHLAQTVHSQDLFVKLTNVLIHFVEQAYFMRDLDALEEVSGVLMNLPVNSARQIGLYYHALAMNRRGHRDEAETLLETVTDNAPITYRARAIQTLGANYYDKGQLDEALRFQLEALRAASDKNAQGLQTPVMAHLEISHVKSDRGDHKGALAILENISPLVRIAAKQNLFYFYAHQNELAIELAESGRIADAKAAAEVALASPYASAYPSWAETRQELEAKRTSATPSVVAISRAPEAEPSPQAEPQRKPHRSKPRLPAWPASENRFLQRTSTTTAPIPTVAGNQITQSILDRVLICIAPRAPPALTWIRPQ
jgi:tetratricopeptide (TPR) repeat protein